LEKFAAQKTFAVYEYCSSREVKNRRGQPADKKWKDDRKSKVRFLTFAALSGDIRNGCFRGGTIEYYWLE
jgi:hypothetical protein